MNMKIVFPVVVLIAAVVFAGCSFTSSGGSAQAAGYHTITAAEAMRMMKEKKNYLIVDVRTKGEYADGHIPGAVNVPNEQIGSEAPKELPNKEQLLLVYCRSGRRSKDAAQKLAAIGYNNIYDFGGINSWSGDIVK